MDSAMRDPEIDKDTANLHPIFTRDPANWMRLVNNQVLVKTDDGCEHIGHIYTVDPVSQSIVLMNHVDEVLDASSNVKMKLLIGSSVTSVDVISEGCEKVKAAFEKLFRPAMTENFHQEELNARKMRLKSWLEKHRLPVTLGGPDGEYLTIADALTVQPPYAEESCISTNEIILARIQGLIKNIPSNQEV